MKPDRYGNEQPLEQLPTSLRIFMMFERFHLHHTGLFQQPSRDASFDTRYFPQNCDAFELPCFWVPRKHLYGCGNASHLTVMREFLDARLADERVLFPVHPASLNGYQAFLHSTGAEDTRSSGLRIWAVPTSSTRTVLAWPDGEPHIAMFLKLTLHSPVFGDRHLYRKTVACSVGLSELVEQHSSRGLPESFRSFPEPIGFTPRNHPDSGFIARLIPPELNEGSELAVPLFALLGDREPLLPRMLECSGLSLQEFVEQVLCRNFARLWLSMWLNLGLILEAHAQDLLLAVTPDFVPRDRFYYRDFEGLQVDWALRKHRGLPSPAGMPHAWRWFETYDTWGYRGYQLLSTKLRTSLFDYMYFVLNEVEQWAHGALTPGEPVSMFWSALRNEVEDRFGAHLRHRDDVFRNLHGAVADLMKLRKALLA